ncbi:hypothetical protein ACQXZL_11870 [Corynebacterium diphtheriae]
MFTKSFDAGFDHSVVDDVTLRGLQKPLLFSQFVGHVVTSHTEFEVVLGPQNHGAIT